MATVPNLNPMIVDPSIEFEICSTMQQTRETH